MVHIFLLFFLFFPDSRFCCKYRSKSDSHLSGNRGFCQNTEILTYRQCGAFAALEKRPNVLQQGAVRSCKRRRQFCLNTFETFPLLMSQRLFKSCSSSSVWLLPCCVRPATSM